MSTFSYSEALVEYVKHGNTLEKTCQFIDENKDWLNLNHVRTILSIGAGSGEVDACIISKTPCLKHYTGIEPDTELCSLLKKNLSTYKSACELEIINNTMESYGIDDHHFDFILMTQVIYYVPNKPVYLKKLVDALTDSGIIFLTTVSPIFGDIEENPQIPQRKYSTTELKEDLEKAGILDYETKTFAVKYDFRDAPDQLINFFFLRGTTENERNGWRQWVMDKFGGIFDNNHTITVFKIWKS